MTVLGQTVDEADSDWKVERSSSDATKFTVTDLASGESSEVDLADFAYEHNSLIKMQSDSAEVGS